MLSQVDTKVLLDQSFMVLAQKLQENMLQNKIQLIRSSGPWLVLFGHCVTPRTGRCRGPFASTSGSITSRFSLAKLHQSKETAGEQQGPEENEPPLSPGPEEKIIC